MISIEELRSIAARVAQGGNLSDDWTLSEPVIRIMGDGVPYVCFCVCNLLGGGTWRDVKGFRPHEWIALSLDDGNVAEWHSCSIDDFSAVPLGTIVSLVDSESLRPIIRDRDDNYYKNLSDLFEQSRRMIIDDGGHVERAAAGPYKEYMDRLMEVTPEDFRVFYRDLSNI